MEVLIRMDRDANFDDDLHVYNWEDKEDKKLIAAIEHKDTGMLKVMLNRLCERIDDMETII